MSGRRLTLFVFFPVTMMTTTILQALWDRLVIPAKADPTGALAGFLAAACILVVFIAGAHADDWANYSPEDEDALGLFHYLKSEVEPDDLVYIDDSLAETAKVYFKILGWSPQNLYFGKTGWPCCTRQIEVQFGNAALENSYVDRDIQSGVFNTKASTLMAGLLHQGAALEAHGRVKDRSSPATVANMGVSQNWNSILQTWRS